MGPIRPRRTDIERQDFVALLFDLLEFELYPWLNDADVAFDIQLPEAYAGAAARYGKSKTATLES